MLDMDGTILDLAYDNYVWRELVVRRYAEHSGMGYAEARDKLYAKFMSMQGDLQWYCLDHWSDHLGIDVLGVHREVHHRIDYLPGARQFLETMHAAEIRVLLVTNSHHDTLDLKEEALGFSAYFDGIYSSHSYGHPKEAQAFWHALQGEEEFDPETTVFVDDTVPVLRSAKQYGIAQTVQVTYPDTSQPLRENGEYPSVKAVNDFI